MKDVESPDIHPLKTTFQDQGFGIIRYDDGPFHAYVPDAPWLHDDNFNKLYETVRGNTLVDRARCYSHYQLMQQAQKVSGDILEVGVWRGGTAGIFAQLAVDRTVYLADTFKGVVKAEPWEVYENGEYADTSKELVLDFMGTLGVTNVKVLEGVFPEDTGHEVADKTFSYVHLDVDVYRSAKDAFDFVWGKVSPGGIVVFDDYGFTTHCGGVTKFVGEIQGDQDKVFVSNMNGQAYIIKR